MPPPMHSVARPFLALRRPISCNSVTSTRAQQDEFAVASQNKAEAAQKAGKFKDEIAPVTIKSRKGDTVVDSDEYPKHGTTADLKRTVIPLARSFERGWKTGVTAPGEAFAPAWHRSRPPSLDRRAVTRHPMTPSDRREPGLQISAGIQG